MSLRTDFSSPVCSVEIYPLNQSDAALFTLSGGEVLELSTHKDITENSGKFSLTIAPGGPTALGAGANWVDVIQPMSLVLIGLQRAGRSNCVMIGVVERIEESTSWDTPNTTGVQRPTTITGSDLSYYFTNYSYFALGLLGLLPGTVQGQALGIGAVAAQQLLNAGFTSGTPPQIGLNFVEQAMFGKGFGLMQNVKVQYKNKAPLSLLDIFGTEFEEFPGSYVQMDYDYVTTEESWYAKFQNIFPAPYYEFFIATAPQGYYGAQSGQLSGYSFKMSSMPSSSPVSVTAVARVNPNPVLTVANAATGTGATVTGADATLWNKLVLFQPDEARPRETDIFFEIGNTANYFAVNPTFAGTMYGAGNSLANTWLLTQNTAIDTSSIIDFGYRPAVLPTAWYGDSTGQISQNATIQDNFPQIAATLIARIASTYGPQHLMATAAVVLPLRPDIMAGQRFRFHPFKKNQLWDFYIQSVNHDFVFGGNSKTTLFLTRGLPSTIYQSAQSPSATSSGSNVSVHFEGVPLQSVLQGKAIRDGFGYEVSGRVSRSGVQFFGPSSNLQSILGQISSGFVNPGA